MKTSHFVASVSIIVNFLLIVFLLTSNPADSSTSLPLSEQSSATYPFLSPRIFINKQNDLLINFKPLRSKVREYEYRLKNRTGFYFEYLPTGNSIGANEKEEFIPASLLKTPLAMGALKEIELGKKKPDEILTVKEKDIDKAFGTLWEKGVGTQITFIGAVEQLIKYSDNTAQHMLFDILSGGEIDDVFDSLDIPKTSNENKTPVVSAKNYSSILRCLYLSCYLNKNTSNQLLKMLSETEYNDKLPAGVPNDIKVAHKIGVSISPEQGEIYTDCGIVYVPKRPYILCIMTESNEDEARVIMQDLSKMVYEYVSSAN